MIRAAALSYAIVFSLLVGLICSGVLFIASTQKRIEVLHNNKERVLFDSYAAVQYGMQHLSVDDSAQFIHANGDTSKIRRIRWGAFDMVTTQTFKGNQHKKRSALIGSKQVPQLPALYLPGNASGLKITGETRVEGVAFLPNARVERAYIAGKNYAYDEMIFGETKTAETALPALREEWFDIDAQDFTANLPHLPYLAKDSNYSFHNGTTCYETIEPIAIANNIAGNVIIHSFDSIVVLSEAKLENVILIAPVIHFQEGFSGSVQAIAHERIHCGKNVQLLYPSVLLLNELLLKHPLSRRHILLEEGAMVLGGVLVTTQQYDYRKPPFLEIRKDATIAGLVYNGGETEIFGTVIGSLYTNQLIARVGGGSYGNHLVDALISQTDLPADFLMPLWLEEQSKVQSKVLAWL